MSNSVPCRRGSVIISGTSFESSISSSISSVVLIAVTSPSVNEILRFAVFPCRTFIGLSLLFPTGMEFALFLSVFHVALP